MMAVTHTSEDYELSKTAYETTIRKEQTNVSLQKYIAAVNGSTSNIPLQPRTNLKAISSSKNQIYASNKFTNEKGSTVSTSYEGYKKTSPVTIKKNDIVTYYIHLYNNGNVSAKVSVNDTLKKTSNSNSTLAFSIVETPRIELSTKGYNSNGSYSAAFNNPLTYSKSGALITFNAITLEANSTARITLKIKIEEQIDSGDLIENNAWIIGDGYNNPNGYRTDDYDYVKMEQPETPKTNVSLQKYIAKVNGQNLTSENTAVKDRWNVQATSQSVNQIFASRTKFENPGGEYDGTSNTTIGYKKINPVLIKQGDIVTYYIYVYANDNKKVDSIIVKDQLTHTNSSTRPSYTIQGSPTIEYSDYGYSYGSAQTLNYTTSNDIITFSSFSLNYQVARITLKVKINEQISKSDMIENNAYIYDTNPDNNTTYRTSDSDYVKMEEPELPPPEAPKTNVSLQKYIGQVNNKNLTSSMLEIYDRWNRKDVSGSIDKIYDSSIFKAPNGSNISGSAVHGFKKDYPVKIAVGDTVTYYIYVYNNDDETAKVNVSDQLSFVSGSSLSESEYTITQSVYEASNDGHTFNGNSENLGYARQGNGIYFDAITLSGKTAARITLKIKFNTDISSKGILENYACIRSTDPTNNTTYRTLDSDYIKMEEPELPPPEAPKTNVSLQKYIGQVNNQNLTLSMLEIYDRWNRKDNSGSINKIYDTSIFKAPDGSDKSGSFVNGFKKEYPVTIAVGDEVTYYIYVYNNDDETAKVNVSDQLSFVSGSSLSESEYTITQSVYETSSDGHTFNGNSENLGYARQGNGIYFDAITLSGKTAARITLKIKFNTDISSKGILENYAYISYTDPNNKTDYRTSDSDYIEMEQPPEGSVSLQKYITQVNNRNLTSDNTSLTSRWNLRDESTSIGQIFNGSIFKNEGGFSSGSSYNTGYKSQTPVIIKQGDTVTYYIYIYNESKDSTKVYVKDTLSFVSNNYLSSSYYSISSITMQYANDAYSFGNISDISYSTSGNTITFNSFNLGGKKAARITLKVKFSTDISAYGVVRNYAYISSTNPSNTTSYRTEDADYVQMVSANVSLQKYIAQVNGQSLTSHQSSIGDRWNLRDTGSSTSQIFGNSGTLKNPNGLWSGSSRTGYKSQNPVLIKKGDVVTYYIYVYNNSHIVDSKVTIEDSLSISNYSVQSATIEFGDGYSFSGAQSINYTNSNGTMIFDQFTLNRNTAARITLKVAFNTRISLGTTVKNYAKIRSVDLANSTTYRTEDADYLQMEEEYKVSLEKYISSVRNDKGVNEPVTSRKGQEEYKTERNGILVDETDRDSRWTQHNRKKELSPVTVGNGYYITYTIEVRNDGECDVYVSEIVDTLPDGISQYREGGYSSNRGDYKSRPSGGRVTITRTAVTLLHPGEKTSVDLTVIVSESNLSMRVLENMAKITKLTNSDGTQLDADTNDKTPYNNQDSDYFQMNLMLPVGIGGMVWNDKALNKQQDSYNGLYDAGSESKLDGIKVYLYRDGENGVVATTTTNSGGNYVFTNLPGRDRVTGGFYSYYVVFEYDGITYTPTDYRKAATSQDTSLTSNAREKLNSTDSFDGRVDKARTTFNNGFGTINNSKGISYTTQNDAGWTPESHHNYNSSMEIQASTEKITIADNATLMAQLQHINLGLRGRDIVDLQLASDIYSTKVTVNGVDGAYNFNNNRVTVRQEDIGIAQDTVNFGREELTPSVSKVDQDIRSTDVKNTQYNKTGLKVQVTYKLTVTNASVTIARANIITDYFDNKYDFAEAYYLNGNSQSKLSANSSNRNGYKSVAITMPSNWLNQNASIDIYLVLDLNNAESVLQQIVNNGTGNIPTFNIAEITEYSTTVTNGRSEYTRGLIDKDSAPGSVDREQARLTTTVGQSTPTVNGNPTTLGYYYQKANEYLNDRSKTEINNLKCEDDTTTSPVLYFTASGNSRTMSGIVFRDNTTTNSSTRIKTGNGKLDSGEVGVYGATVELIELVGNSEVVRGKVTTGRDGRYTFSGFLPGDYLIRYHYGDTTNTVLLNQAGSNINRYSYNGEDYQATNNTGHGAEKLNDTPDFWYVYNENQGVSTATDSISRRNTVSANVTNFTDEQMTVLNDIRDGKTVEQSVIQDIINKTNMESNTPKFHITVEKTEITSGGLQEKAAFSPYNVTNMNFGIAEVPVTTIDLTKQIKEFSIIDSSGTNVMAKASRNASGVWETEGEVLRSGDQGYDVSIIDERLQGAKLTVTYEIKATIAMEKNFNNGNAVVPTITGIVDFIDNDLSYNPELGDNDTYWELTTFDQVKSTFAQAQYKQGSIPQGTVDPNGSRYQSFVKAKASNPLLTPINGTATAEITLEKVLSSTDSTFEEIVTSTVDGYEYNNTIEITGLNYRNVTDDGTEPQRDRVRIPTRYIILPGVQHDSATSDTINIHPPTGDSSMMITYYVIAAASLIVLAGGIFIIKKYVIAK